MSLQRGEKIQLSLSESQKSVLALEKTVGSSINLICFSILWNSCGHAAALKDAAEEVCGCFPMLRMVFDLEHATQSEAPNTAILDDEILSFSSKDDYCIWADRQPSLNPETQSARISIVQIAGKQEGYHIFLHHLIADGWAAALLIRTLCNAYTAKLQKCSFAAPESPSYAQFISDEQAHFASKRGQKEAAFWKEFLKDHSLYKKISDHSNGNFSAERISKEVPASLSASIKQLCARQNCSPVVMMSVAAALSCHGITDAGHFCLGMLMLNRLNDQEEQTFGNYFSTLPLPVHISENMQLSVLFDQITDHLFAILRRQRTSYQRVTEQAFDCLLGGTLFDVLINYQDFQRFDIGDAEVSWYPPKSQVETLQIGVMDMRETMQIHYDYRPDCISAGEIQQFHSRILAALEDIVSRPWNISITDIHQACQHDRDKINQWNQTQYPFPEEDTLCSLFARQLANCSQKTALIDQSCSMTYESFDRQVNDTAAWLLDHGVKPGDIVAVCMDRSCGMLTAIHAVLRCGAAYMPISTDTPEERLHFMMKDSGSRLLLTDESNTVAGAPAFSCLVFEERSVTDASFISPRAEPGMPAYVIYTSGSTGTPKGAVISHKSIVNRIHWMHRIFKLSETDVLLQKTPYTFDVSVWELFWWSCFGGTLAILPPEGHKDPAVIVNAIRENHVTKIHFVPSMLSAFLAYVDAANCQNDMHALQQVFVSGEALTPAHVNRFYGLFPWAELINLYGPTECTVDVSCYRCPHAAPDSVPIGTPVDNTHLYVLDKYLRQVPMGAPGELCVGGVLVGMGYLNRPDLTAEKFITLDSERIYRTGDLACWTEKGQVMYLGRMDSQVKLRGQRLELGEIEEVMMQFDGIREAATAIQETEDGEQHLVCFYTVQETAVDEEAFMNYLKRHLAAYMLPQALMKLEKMPQTESGKIARKQLPKVEFAQIHQDHIVPPATQMEKELCIAFANALHVNQAQVGLNTHFFEMGGTSLQVAILMAALYSRYPLRFQDVYNHPTPGQLAKLIETSVDGQAKDNYESERAYCQLHLAHKANPGIPPNKAILITGTTGFLGIHLLHELLKRHPERQMICLVRSEEKLRKNWAAMFSQQDYPACRIHAIKGDLSKADLGMSSEDYRWCAANTGAVYHAAADVRHFGKWEDSYEVNTLGTSRIVAFCKASKAQLHHISTMSVNGYILTKIGPRLCEEFTEDHLFIGQHFRDNVYVHSKYLAEKEVLRAMKDGVMANIYRVGNLLWRSSDGQFQQNRERHDFYMLTHTFLQLQADIREFADLRFDLTAVDQTAEAICLLSENYANGIFHMMNPCQTTLHEYLQKLTSAEIRSLPMDQFIELLSQHREDSQFGIQLAYAEANRYMTADQYPAQRCEQTVDWLEHIGFHWIPPTDRYLRYVL